MNHKLVRELNNQIVNLLGLIFAIYLNVIYDQNHIQLLVNWNGRYAGAIDKIAKPYEMQTKEKPQGKSIQIERK